MENIKNVTVAILAGGLGTRISKVLPGQQKVVAKVKDHPFLEYILNQLSMAGFKKIILCTGHLGHQITEIFGDNYKNLSLTYSNETQPLGTAGAVRNALRFLNSQTILVANGDSFYDSDLQKFYVFHMNKKASGTILLTKVSNTGRYGKVDLDDNGQITGFHEKDESTGVGFINGGIYLLSKSFLLEIPENKKVSFETEMFPKWVGKNLFGFRGQGRFIDIGTPESYTQAQEFFSEYTL